MSQQNEHRPPAIQLAQQTAHLSYSVIGFGASVFALHNEFYDKIQNAFISFIRCANITTVSQKTQFQITSRSELFVRFLFFSWLFILFAVVFVAAALFVVIIAISN